MDIAVGPQRIRWAEALGLINTPSYPPWGEDETGAKKQQLGGVSSGSRRKYKSNLIMRSERKVRIHSRERVDHVLGYRSSSKPSRTRR